MATKIRSFLLSAVVVAAVAMLSSSCYVQVDNEPTPEVRFTWAKNQERYITSIAASYKDVKNWYDTYYADISYDIEDATDVPLNRGRSGSNDLPDNLFPARGNRGEDYYKGRYLPISSGTYTAVCTVEDQYGYADIVANYMIAVSGSYRYFEIAFDVKKILAGNDDPEWEGDGWFFDEYNRSGTVPWLEKTPAKKGLVKTIEGESVTYYVFRRPKV